MKIEIELTPEGDFKYKGVEIWAYEEDGCFYRINEYGENFIKLSDAILYIDEKLGNKHD